MGIDTLCTSLPLWPLNPKPYRSLQDDPEMEDFFAEIKQHGMAALSKYMTDQVPFRFRFISLNFLFHLVAFPFSNRFNSVAWQRSPSA